MVGRVSPYQRQQEIILQKYDPSNSNRTGNIAEDVPRYLALYDRQDTAEHCTAVAANAKELAEKFGSDPDRAEQAGFLHDISAVIPIEERIDFALSRGVEVLPAEEQSPMILHQKLSVVVAKEIFNITDNELLSAIGCHSTLKAKASLLDKVVFLADKTSWDRGGKPPYLSKVTTALEVSLDAAVLEYMNYLWEQRSQLQIIHPWFVEAREELLQGTVQK